jgi:hypothetical protein
VLASTCQICRAGHSSLTPVIALAETIAPVHHHHVRRCLDCGHAYYDDVVTGAYGQPVPSRRETFLCGCPVDGTPRYRKDAIVADVPESACRCGPRALAEARPA